MDLDNIFNEDSPYILTKSEREKARARAVRKSLTYFENRSLSEKNLWTRRRNLAAHLGVDETVSKQELNMINVYALPVPAKNSSNTNLW